MAEILGSAHTALVAALLLLSLWALSRSADALVGRAVELSRMRGLSEALIGATVVSLGTTLPELAAAVVSALEGHGAFALGNAAGSVIANSSLVLGAAALTGVIPAGRREFHKLTVLAAAFLLMAAPSALSLLFGGRGLIPRWHGAALLAMTPLYLLFVARLEKGASRAGVPQPGKEASVKAAKAMTALFLSALLVALSAAVLVDSAEILARRAGVPDALIASTLVALGTSVPELGTAAAAVKSGHGELALGNILGANTLNILFVVGAAAALSGEGIAVPGRFMAVNYAAIALILASLALFIRGSSTGRLSRREGGLLAGMYCAYLAVSLLFA